MTESLFGCVKWTGSLLIQGGFVLLKLDDQVQKLRTELERMQKYLRDADARPGKDVSVLTASVRKLAYDAEDLIDSYNLKVIPSIEMTDRNWLIRSVNFIQRSAFPACLIANRISKILADINLVMDRTRQDSRMDSPYMERRPTTYPHDGGESVVGLRKDVRNLARILTSRGQAPQVGVLSIVGMGGSGKTTLAKKLYNHKHIKKCFDCRAWVFISQQWSTKELLSQILRQVGGTNNQEINANTSKEDLVRQLHHILEQKSCLVVLDGVWSSQVLKDMIPALPQGKNFRGSKIIITTRYQKISPESSYIHKSSPLDENQSWKLLSKCLLSFQSYYNSMNIQSFESLGREMLRQCDGLPLAVIELAGILSTKTSIGTWLQVSNAVRTRLIETTGTNSSSRVEEMLALTYDDLPYVLKPCFLLFGLFPEDFEIPSEMLTQMWAADGLVASSGSIPVEDVATELLEELNDRFLIQVAKRNLRGEITAMKLHGLVHDFCVKKAREQSFLEVYTSREQANHIGLTAPLQPRRAALHSSSYFPNISNLKSLLLLTRSSVSPSSTETKETIPLDHVVRNFKLLRVLNLWDIKVASGTLPERVGELVHLRYLGIRSSNITELPSSIGDLRNLLTLDYRDVISDNNEPIKIPNVLWKLVQLRHLFLPIECPWSIQELKLKNLSNLQTLWGLKQEGDSTLWLREVSAVSRTLRKLRVMVSKEEEAVTILSLGLMSEVKSETLQTFHCELRNGLTLRHGWPICDNHHLRELTLIGQIQIDLPLILPAKIVMLELKDTMIQGGDPLTPLGKLSYLKFLKLSNFYMGSCLCCKPGSFPQLEELYLENLENLVEWTVENGAMICLKKLNIVGCKMLNFPNSLEFVTTLQLKEFEGVSEQFAQAAKQQRCSSSKQYAMPHNFDAIIKKCDSTVDISCTDKLYEQLHGMEARWYSWDFSE